MRKVKDLEYVRYTVEQAEDMFAKFVEEYNSAKSVEDILLAREKIVDEIKKFSTAVSLTNMRFTLNTRDEFYVKEKGYYDEITPIVTSFLSEYAKMMLESKFRKELEEKINPILFKQWEVARLAHDPKIIEEEQKENAITTEYSTLISQMQFDYKGKKVPLSILRGELSNEDRQTRKEAAEAIGRGLQENSEKLDDLMDQLVEIRDLQAKKMGYENFVTLGYYRMGRVDYDKSMVSDFRKNILKSIVPVVNKLKEKIAKDLAIDKFMIYDNDVYISGGNPRPKLDKEGIFKAAQEMYDEMHPELGSFFKKMVDAEAFDVESRDGKCAGGYCTAIDSFEQIFIFANFNGTADDIDVVTHEFGHAYAMDQVYRYGEYELGIGGMETAECHSMSMEYFAWKYIDKFFDNSRAYQKRHLLDSLSFLPYGVIVDEFQHIIYTHPELTKEERKKEWNKLEAKYRPYMTAEGVPYLEEGTRWQYQTHIYEVPFYYIDYVLAGTVAMAFLVDSQKDYDDALNRYIDLARVGGTRPFSQLVKGAKIAYPFGEGTLDSLGKDILLLLEKLE